MPQLHQPCPLREGQCLQVDGQRYEVVDVDIEHEEIVVNVADCRGRSLQLGHLMIPFVLVGAAATIAR